MYRFLCFPRPWWSFDDEKARSYFGVWDAEEGTPYIYFSMLWAQLWSLSKMPALSGSHFFSFAFILKFCVFAKICWRRLIRRFLAVLGSRTRNESRFVRGIMKGFLLKSPEAHRWRNSYCSYKCYSTHTIRPAPTALYHQNQNTKDDWLPKFNWYSNSY